MFILVADDAEDIRITTQLLLEHFGHEVDTAENGQVALEHAIKRAPEAVLMDLSMPIMDGFTATKHLRELPSMRDVPILAVSAYVHDKVWCDRAVAAGCNACLGKPLNYEQLGAMLERFGSAA